MAMLKRREHRDQPERGLAKHAPEQKGLGRFREEMNRAFDRVWREFDRDPWSAMTHLPEAMGTLTDWPAMDVAEDDKAVTLRVDVPGLDSKDVDVEVSGDQLTIRGQRNDEFEDHKHGVLRRERHSGSFVRTVTLPSYVDADKIQAHYDKGMLTITVPKVLGKGPKRVEVKT